MKEMVGGCCVCSDERGWPENPLVYCDGQGCTVAVHQACYGIVTVPTGPWFCRKCESQERAARVRCELCPSRDGALKKTDNMGWAHVVCALYIPEVRFGNVTTMEPIILQLIPPERYNKSCYICAENGKGNRASAGACMQCNKSGCKQQFHVTCAQQLGLLCEEAGNYLDNVKYCGYCQHHYGKLKKGGNVKPIPPYKPVSHAEHSSDAPSSPEKELEKASSSSTSSRQAIDPPSKQRKSSSTSKNSNSLSSSSAGQLSSTQNTSNSSTTSSGSSHPSSTSTSSGFVSGSSSSSTKNSSSSNSSKEKEKHTKSTSKGNKAHDKESSSITQNSTSSSSSSSSSAKSKYSKNNSTSNNNKDDQNLSSTNISSITSHKQNNSNNNSDSSNQLKSEKPISSQSNPILQPARLNVVSPQMGNLSNAKQDSNVQGASNTNNSTSNNNTTNNSNNKEFGQKFTTSNFTQSVVMKSDSVFGNGGNESNKGPPNSSSNNSANSNQSNINNTGSNNMSGTTSGSKKRKSDGRITSGTNIDESNKDIIKDLSVTLVPLQGYDKIEVADAEKSIKKFCISQPKSEAGAIVTTSAGTPTEPTLQNLSPNIVSSKQQQNLLNVQSTNSGTNNHSGKQLKEQQQNQVTVSGVPPNSTPSLVVSVPLSTANVPGVNLSSNTSNNNSNNNNNLSVPSIQQQQGTAGNTYQAHRNESGNIHNSTLDRHSPLIQHRTSSPAVHSISPIDHGLVHSGSGGGPNTNMMDTQNPSTMLKFTYEKHPNSRLTTLQEDTSPTVRRSRSHSIDGNNAGGGVINSSNNNNNSSGNSNSNSKAKGRTSKKRGASNVVATPEPTEPSSLSHVGSSNNSSSGGGGSNNTNNQSNCNNLSNATMSHNMGIGQSMTSQGPTLNNTNNNSSSSSNSDIINIPSSVSPAPPVHVTTKKIRRMSTIESSSSPSTSRTPEVMYSSSSSSGFSGLKFGYESQTPSSVPSSQPSVVVTQPPTIKDSPPSSPGSEVGTKKPSKKQKTASSSSNTTVSAISPVETKENKLFHNGVHAAAHMLGNQLNPNSSMAPKLTESLNMEIEAHIANATPLNDQNNLVGPTYPGKLQANRSSVLTTQGTTSSMSLSSMLAGSTSASGNTPQSLEQLLERQWEQGSQFLMEQAQHFDIASLLSCLHQLKSENIRLEEHVTNLVARRDHLLAVNARLAIPLNPNTSTNQGHFNNMHPAVNGPTTAEPTVVSITSSNSNSQGNVVSSGGSGRQRISNSQSQQQPQQLPSQMQQQYSGGALPLENGIDFRQQAQTQQIVRHSSGSQSYSTSSSRSSSIGRGSSSASYTSQQTIYNTHQATIRRDDVKPS